MWGIRGRCHASSKKKNRRRASLKRRRLRYSKRSISRPRSEASEGTSSALHTASSCTKASTRQFWLKRLQSCPAVVMKAWKSPRKILKKLKFKSLIRSQISNMTSSKKIFHLQVKSKISKKLLYFAEIWKQTISKYKSKTKMKRSRTQSF